MILNQARLKFLFFGLFLITTFSGFLNVGIETDREVATKYCSGCHLFPEPQLLDKKTWRDGVLPNMAWRLGIRNKKDEPFEDMDGGEKNLVKALNIYPEIRIISDSDWKKILRFYETEAPEVNFPKVNIPLASEKIPFFEIYGINLKDQKMPQISMVKNDILTDKLFVGDAQNELFELTSTFEIQNVWKTDSPPVDIVFSEISKSVLTIGSISPSEKKKGRLTTLDTMGASIQKNLRLLQRPTHVVSADINQDGVQDWIVSEFGNHSGGLVWFDGQDGRKKHVIKSQAGARKVEVVDLNNDAKLDVVAMFAQAQEEIVVFYNEGKGNFSEKIVLKFPPVYGLSYFELADINADGALDIVMSNGDNWDLSNVNKNYHGVRVFLNDKKDNFSEEFFFPLFGASKVLSLDFDQDGDLDLAAISFYSDYEHGFVLLENLGDFKFKAYTSPEFGSGKWLTMEKLDFDEDGDLDLVLGSYMHNAAEMANLMLKGVETFPQLLVLKNKLK
ncbi:VCBS repeat-containing protein [Lacihabitans sp. LS3-19]|uniref:FG-GAP repeat domain-containing protein n=1 Tax=Lacihabitans sp. LS3-19 TaxID=2487335 RepID=UPI0020CD046E|nr:VCBS repeat-containing protein [Lacihabitans sp. LS3-19]MCP9766460.1 VCBS repeat-containing protein [Lacihabitans sp. LS3-19]